MITRVADRIIDEVPALEQAGRQWKQPLHRAVLRGGYPARRIADFLHGTWLGHPLHPVLTDVAIGAWTLGTLFDALSLGSRSRHLEQTADTMTTIGIAAAVPTALTGLTDYSTIPQAAAGTGLLHGLLNTVGLALYGLSLWFRRRGQRGTGLSLSAVAFGLLTVSAWLGGHLVYKQRVGVDHSHPVSKPEHWQPVLPETDLVEQEPRRIKVSGNDVLLYRYGGTIYAIEAVCSHAGGPLEQGEFDGVCVQCPWHDSVFDLRDGSIVHGPTTYPQPAYDARIYNGQVEIRAAQRG